MPWGRTLTPPLLAPTYTLSVLILSIFLPMLERYLFSWSSLSSILLYILQDFVNSDILYFDHSWNVGVKSQEKCICSLWRYMSGYYLFILSIHSCPFKKRFYLFNFRGEGKEIGRETSKCGWLSYAPYWEPGPQPRHVPWVGIELATLWFSDWCSIHWATPARAHSCPFDVPPGRQKKKKEKKKHIPNSLAPRVLDTKWVLIHFQFWQWDAFAQYLEDLS